MTVPEKIAPAARAIRGKPIVPGGVMGKCWRRSVGAERGLTSGSRWTANSDAESTRPDWPCSNAGASVRIKTASRHLQLLPCMGRPQDVTSARRDTGETGQPIPTVTTKSVADVTTSLWISGTLVLFERVPAHKKT